MNWIARHLDSILVGVALILSVMWIGNYIVQPRAGPPTVSAVDDHYVPPILRIGEVRGAKNTFQKPVRAICGPEVYTTYALSSVPSVEDLEARVCFPGSGTKVALRGALFR
jgi:hypothetical protein